MAISPYSPTAFTTPVVNPAIGGMGTPYPYISVSQYQFAPTAIDTSNLVPGGNAAAQTQSLADTIRRASGWADRLVFGADAASKGASLSATLTTEMDYMDVIRGELRLICDYKPIISVQGIDIGPTMGALQSVGSSIASTVRIARRTVFVPLMGFIFRNGQPANSTNPSYPFTKLAAVWSYINGYPHTQLAATVTATSSAIPVMPTDGGTGLLGIIPGTTQLTIVDGAATERVTVASLGTTVINTITYPVINTVTPLLNTHTLPTAPDAINVTTMPQDVMLATIFLVSMLIKTRGDNSVELTEIGEPRAVRQAPGDQWEDYSKAKELLKPFRVRIKAGRH